MQSEPELCERRGDAKCKRSAAGWSRDGEIKAAHKTQRKSGSASN